LKFFSNGTLKKTLIACLGKRMTVLFAQSERWPEIRDQPVAASLRERSMTGGFGSAITA
jgi:hypothetical protein